MDSGRWLQADMHAQPRWRSVRCACCVLLRTGLSDERAVVVDDAQHIGHGCAAAGMRLGGCCCCWKGEGEAAGWCSWVGAGWVLGGACV